MSTKRLTPFTRQRSALRSELQAKIDQAALEELQSVEMLGTRALTAAPIVPAARRAPAAEGEAHAALPPLGSSAAAAAAAQDAAAAALGHFKGLFGLQS